MSKRDDIQAWPTNWPVMVWEKVPKTYTRGEQKGQPHALAMAAAICRLASPRPAEIEAGIRLAMASGDIPGVAIRITGVKTDTITSGFDDARRDIDRGLGSRTITYRLTTPEACFLYEVLKAYSAPGKWYTYKYNAGTLRVSMATLGRKALPGVGGTLSPYCYRHELAGMLKACEEISRQDAARVLGHASTRSLRHYGVRRRGVKALKPYSGVYSKQIPRDYGHTDIQQPTTKPGGGLSL